MIYDTIKKLIFFLFCLSVSHQVLALSPLSRDKIEWSNSLCLPAVDNEPNIGVAGAFSGFIGKTLVIAGGANFPEAMPWEERRNGGIPSIILMQKIHLLHGK